MDFSSQAMLLQNAQWPYSFPYKSYDFGLHPAFLQSAYRPLPNTQYGGTTEQTEQSHTVTQKVDKFSIDAILKKDKSDEKDIVEKSESVKQQDSPKSATDEMELACRRYQRLYEIGHPYISQHQQTGAEKSYLHKHLHTFKQFSDRSRAAEKVEKKPSQLQDTWSKQTKGKRVRTIFTPEQLERMEAEFERQQYMVGTERYYLASALNLTEAQVKVWFQNRRIKWRKQHLEQQQAKLKSLNMYKDVESESDSENDDVISQSDTSGLQSHVTSVSDPFQSPKEERCTQ